MNCELMLTYDTPAYMFSVYKNQLSRQTGSRNLTGPKTLPPIWHTYMKHVTKYQISAINSYWEKCDGWTEGQTEVKQYTPPPVKRGYNNKIVDPIRMKQMYRIKLISNTALITKSLLLNRIIEKLLFESLQTNLIINFCYPFLCWYVTNVFFIDLFLLNSFCCLKTNILTIYIYWTVKETSQQITESQTFILK